MGRNYKMIKAMWKKGLKMIGGDIGGTRPVLGLV